MEAETYLSSGFGIRVAIESKRSGWKRFGALAKVWMPGRLKGIQVSRAYGTPFFAATQVFDVRPFARKWLALGQTEDAESRFVAAGTILVTCSGSVGRPTLAYAPHQGVLISHDLLRVNALDRRDWGWLYAFLRSPQARAMTSGQQYGHIIKHLEVPHLEALPVPAVDDSTAAAFARRVVRILELRNECHRATLEAEELFETCLGGAVTVSDWGEDGFAVNARAFLGGRRRFDATAHNPGVAAIRRHLKKHGKGFTTVKNAGYEAWIPTRFQRVPAKDGVTLVGSADLTEVNPDLPKRIADGDFGEQFRGRVEPGWILVARSGQTYGIIGTAVLAGESLREKVISDDVMRLRPLPDADMRPGYLVTALSHPSLGRPVVKAVAYGSSIPHIEATDLAALEVVRLRPEDESAIAAVAEGAAAARAKADLLEQEIARDATDVIEHFIRHGR